MELLQVKWSEVQSLDSVKEKVRQRTGYDPEELLFLLNGQLTEREAWSERIRPFKSLKVGQRVTADTLFLWITCDDIDPQRFPLAPTESVGGLKIQIQERLHIPTEDQVLVRCKRALDKDDTHLSAYALMSGHTLNLYLRSKNSFCLVTIKPDYTLWVQIDSRTTGDSLKRQICKDLGGFPARQILKTEDGTELLDTAVVSADLVLQYSPGDDLEVFTVTYPDGRVAVSIRQTLLSHLSNLTAEISRQTQLSRVLVVTSELYVLTQPDWPLYKVPSQLVLVAGPCFLVRRSIGQAYWVRICYSLREVQEHLAIFYQLPVEEQVFVYQQGIVTESSFNSQVAASGDLQLILLRDEVSLFIYKAANSWIHIKLPYGSCIGWLKQLIEQVEGLPAAEQLLVHSGKELIDSATLPECGLLPGSSLMILTLPLQIFTYVMVRVVFMGAVLGEVNRRVEMRVGDLLSELGRARNVEISRLALFRGDERLDVSTPLENLENEDAIELELCEYLRVTFKLGNTDEDPIIGEIPTSLPLSSLLNYFKTLLNCRVSLHRPHCGPPYREADLEVVVENALVGDCLRHGDLVVVVRLYQLFFERVPINVTDFTSVSSIILKVGDIGGAKVYKQYEIMVNSEVLTEENRSLLINDQVSIDFHPKSASERLPRSPDRLLAAAFQAKFPLAHFFGATDIQDRRGNQSIMNAEQCRWLISALMQQCKRPIKRNILEISVFLEGGYEKIILNSQQSVLAVKQEVWQKWKIPIKEQILVSSGHVLTEGMLDWQQHLLREGKMTVIWAKKDYFFVVPTEVFTDNEPRLMNQSYQRFPLALQQQTGRYSYSLLPSDPGLCIFQAIYPAFLLPYLNNTVVLSRVTLQQATASLEHSKDCVLVLEIYNRQRHVLQSSQETVVVARKRYAVPSALLVKESMPAVPLTMLFRAEKYTKFAMSPLDSVPDIVRRFERHRVIFRPYQTVRLKQGQVSTELFDNGQKSDESKQERQRRMMRQRQSLHSAGIRGKSTLQLLQSPFSSRLER